MILLLAVYGPHTGHPARIRDAFWQQRLRELRSIRSKPYRDCPFVLLGDTNLHFPSLGPTNARMASTLDKQLFSVFCSPDGFNASVGNQPAVPTHASGSVIDLEAAEEVLALDLEVSWLQEEALRSDHAFLVCSCHNSEATTSWGCSVGSRFVLG